jgi:hypothetical protein
MQWGRPGPPVAAKGFQGNRPRRETSKPLSSGYVAAWKQIQQHDTERRQRLVHILTLGIMIPVLLLIPSSLFPKFILGSLVALVIVFTGTITAFLLNRMHLVLAAGYALVAGVALALAWQIVSKVLLQHGVDALDLRYYDLMVLPVLLSAVLIGRRGPIVIAGCVSAFSLVSLLVLPRTPTLESYWNASYPYSLGSAYDVVALAVLFQLIAGVIGWLGSDSIRRALVHALQVDQLAQANQQIQAQAQEIEAQRQHLHEGMAQIQQVHAAIGRGQWDARVRVQQGELLPMAMSLNLLLDRLTRLTREQTQRNQIEATAHALATAMHRARSGMPFDVPDYTGTVLDEVLMEFAALRPMFSGSRAAGGYPEQQAPGTPGIPPQRGSGPSTPWERQSDAEPFDFGPWPPLE